MMMPVIDKIIAYPAWETLFPGTVYFDEPGAAHTSMGVGGKIDILMYPKSIKDLREMIRLLHRQGIPHAVVGNWTNLIITEQGYRGALICTKGLNRITLLPRTKGSSRIQAEAGVSLSELVALTLRENLTGFEFCAGIPGSVGGGVRMNAGAYGHSISEAVCCVTLMDAQGKTKSLESDELRFEYRNFCLPEKTIIVEAVFLFPEDPDGLVGDKVKKIVEERRSKHPLQYKNAGSIFRNPKDQPAGRLIEEVGLKGFTIGDAMISEKHGNFIVNRGHATADEILALIRHIQERVNRVKGIVLELEVKIMGERD
jgi:UDP-N-acetylmuramate dehydrogenase